MDRINISDKCISNEDEAATAATGMYNIFVVLKYLTMDLAAVLILIISFIAMACYIADLYVHKDIIASRKYLLRKFMEAKEKHNKLRLALISLIEEYDAWDLEVFNDSEVTFKEYLDLLKERFDIEFSDEEFERLKRSKLTRGSVGVKIESLKYQQDQLIKLRHELIEQRRRLENNFTGEEADLLL